MSGNLDFGFRSIEIRKERRQSHIVLSTVLIENILEDNQQLTPYIVEIHFETTTKW